MSDNQAFVLEQISKSIYTLSPRRKGRSLMWNILSEIISQDGTILEGYIYCRECSEVIKYSAKQSSNLMRHKCCKTLKELKSFNLVTEDDKLSAVDACVSWTIEDGLPFSIIKSSGFSKIAKLLITIGDKYGENIDIDDLLPDEKTLSCAAQKLASEKRSQISDEIFEIVNSGKASATIDMRTDDYVRRKFLGVTLHYQKDLTFFNIVLGIKSMDFESSTSVKILNKLNTLFNEFGINNIKQIKFVTDSGSNIEKALENNIRLNCNSHLFANVLEQSFKATVKLTELVEACKKIIKYFKKVNSEHHLPTSLNNDPSPIGWNATFTLFKFIVENWFQINEILNEKKEGIQKLLLIDISTLKEIVEMFGAFELILKKLQQCSSPSICFVVPSIQKVKNLCKRKESDVATITSLKENILINIEKIWVRNIGLWERTAFFLYPPALNVKQSNMNEIKNFCITQIESFPSRPCTPDSEHVSQLSPAEDSYSSDSDAESSSRSQFKRDVLFFFPDLYKNPVLSTKKTAEEELDRYCKEDVEINDEFDVLKWWKLNEMHYPRLSKFALQVHSIPASKAAAERALLWASKMINKKKNQLEPKAVDSLVFLNSYFKNFEN